jgi:hypothetical protein
VPDIFEAVNAFKAVEEAVTCILGIPKNKEDKVNNF